MDAALDMLKLTEAAVVARVALRDVNRAIDEHILPEGFVSNDDGRRVAVVACTLISFYVDSAERLTAKERMFAIHEVDRASTSSAPAGLSFWTGRCGTTS